MSADTIPAGESRHFTDPVGLPSLDNAQRQQSELATAFVDNLEQDTATVQRHAPFSCNVCKRSYSRVDHLARHYRSHTREKPFPCEVCGKHFARADLLKRHAAGHADEANNKRKRRSSPSTRASVACAACSSAKLKCGDEKPCRRCVKKGVECVPLNNGHTNNRVQQFGSDTTAETPVPEQLTHQRLSGPAQMQQDSQSQQQVEQCSSQLNRVAPPVSPSLIPNPEALPYFTALDPNLPGSSPSHAINGFDASAFAEDQTSANTAMHDSFVPNGASLSDFLADIMIPISPTDLGLSGVGTGISESLVRDVFDFGNNINFELDDLDLGLLNSYTVPASPSHQQLTADENPCPPSHGEENNGPEVDFSVEAFQRSLWRWTPGKLDQGHCEQMNLSLPHDIGASISHTVRPCGEALGQPARDKIMAMVFNTCEQEALSRIISQFPSTEILDHLMQEFLSLHDSRPDSFLHIPTFQPQCMRPELVAMAVSCGAVRSSVQVVRKLGFALQEAVRLALPKAYEQDNSMTRNLQLLQTNILELEVGLWSGNKRKMEIAESHGLPMITMLRRSGRLKRLRKPPAAPAPSDPPQALDVKWRTWIEAESFKRLVYYIGTYDSQLSMSFHVPPLIAYGETSLDLPASVALWKAKTASDWRDEYLAHESTVTRGSPAVIACVHTAHDMLEVQDRIDLAFSINIALSLFWKVIWDARQLDAATKPYAGRPVTASLTSSHWQHELSQTLQNFCMIVGEAQVLSPATNVLHEHLLLNVYVSFQELSLFAGKEGHREARRVLPSLKKWADNRDSRQALWHAGQLLREATTFAPATLQGFYAVSLYHAGLTLWAYGLLTNGLHRAPNQMVAANAGSNRRRSISEGPDVVFLDGTETGDTQKFVALKRATPVIKRRHITHDSQTVGEAVHLDDPKAVMETVISILQQNHSVGSRRAMPALVENLIHLMQDLGKVVTNVTKKSQ